MANLQASDNPFPSILIEEATEPAAPAAGHQRVYIDSTTHVPMITNSSGTQTPIDGSPAHIADTSAAHAASAIAFTPHGSIAATDVQAAIQEVRDEAAAGAGAMATDALWDAAGDLAIGTGSNTGARLAIGSSGAVLVSNGTTAAWVVLASGKSSVSSGLTTTSTTFVDMTGASVTITTGARRVLIGFTGAGYVNGANNKDIFVDATIDGTSVSGGNGITREMTVTSNTDEHNLSFVFMSDVLSAASHTFKAQWKVSANTGNIYGPGTFWVHEVL